MCHSDHLIQVSGLILTVASPQVPALLEDDQSSSSEEDGDGEDGEDGEDDEDEKKPSEEGFTDRKVLHMFI